MKGPRGHGAAGSPVVLRASVYAPSDNESGPDAEQSPNGIGHVHECSKDKRHRHKEDHRDD